MQEHAWAEGYVVEIGYTSGFYRELTPALLQFVTVLGEVPAADVDKPFTYHELGCGNGYTTALLAAANPQGRFIGVDFNPTHIHNARGLAAEAGIANVEFLEKSFAEMARPGTAEADVIALHGVYSWVSAENRGHIVEFIRRTLKPGGIVYASYNCLPGQCQIAPLQRLLYDHASRGTGPLADRLARSLEFARQLDAADADFFRASPFARMRLRGTGRQNPEYLAHEYYNENWTPFYHADVARDLGEAKLSYAGSANLIENFDQFMLTPELAALVAQAGDGAMRETIKDFARNKVFRKDVFTRGAPRANPGALDVRLGRLRFALARPRASCLLHRKMPAGELNLQPEAYAPVLDALARGPMTFDELAAAPETAGMGRGRVRQALFGMAALENVLPALSAADEGERRAACAKFNSAVLARPLPRGDTMLASPVLGTGIALNVVDRLLLDAPRRQAQAVEHALKGLLASGTKLRKGDQTLESLAELRAPVEERTAFFLGDLLPYLQQIGIAD
ncbi:MAG TPA: class I SAM-dependent methyltransferase [Burkholderiales bacterium]|nr:class I SAM-dependent methyltransferase [Burkholderiales bacterium]